MAKKKNKEPIKSTKDPRFRSFLMAVMRRASRFWRPSDVCIEKTRITRGVHLCPSCQKTFPRKDMKKDHIDPVIPIEGFSTWDNIVERLFVGEEGWQAICVTCHDKKTREENEKRKALKKEKAVLNYYKKKMKEED